MGHDALRASLELADGHCTSLRICWAPKASRGSQGIVPEEKHKSEHLFGTGHHKRLCNGTVWHSPQVPSVFTVFRIKPDKSLAALRSASKISVPGGRG